MTNQEDPPRDPPALQRASKEVEADVARQLLLIHEDSYGTSKESVEVLLGKDTVVVLFDDIQLQRNEEYLVASGRGSSVIAVRSEFQQTIEDAFRAAVERATGRRVISFASTTKLDPNYAVEIFRLEPDDSQEAER